MLYSTSDKTVIDVKFWEELVGSIWDSLWKQTVYDDCMFEVEICILQMGCILSFYIWTTVIGLVLLWRPPGPLVENHSCVRFLILLYVTLKSEKKKYWLDYRIFQTVLGIQSPLRKIYKKISVLFNVWLISSFLWKKYITGSFTWF